MRNPSRNLAVAFTGGVLIVTAVYLLLSVAFVAVVPVQQIQSNAAFVALFGQALFGTAGARVLATCVVLCVLGGLMVLTMAVPRVTLALAQGESGNASRGALAAFAQLHPRFGTPANGVLLQTAMALLVLTLGAFDRILAYIIFPSVVFLALTAATLFRVIIPGKRWWYPFAPILFIAGSGVLALMLLLHNPGAALLGAGIVLCGLPVRWLLVPRDEPVTPATEDPLAELD